MVRMRMSGGKSLTSHNARRRVKMAIDSDPLDEPFLHTEVNKAVVCRPVQSVESQLSFLCHNNHWCRHEAAGNYMNVVPRTRG